MTAKDEAKAATPHHDLIAELLNPNIPKTEREHAASREIERLQALAAPVQEPVAQAWDEGYRAGIDDERTSEASIGIAGFDAKVEPARNNPYRTTPPAAQRQWVGLAEADKHKPDMGGYVYLNDDWLDGYKTGMEYAEAILKEKNA